MHSWSPVTNQPVEFINLVHSRQDKETGFTSSTETSPDYDTKLSDYIGCGCHLATPRRVFTAVAAAATAALLYLSAKELGF